MLAALIRGKLSREQENMEDILTSNVFGMCVSARQEALLPFIAEAETPEGSHPLANLSSNVRAEFSFWPWIQESGCIGCEPDVVYTFDGTKREEASRCC